ncbi:MAG: hypothetical protein HZA00_10820 [Nitrospinae bacterium]|nr:hypothetical protein [Nitrospinota bacterium]
MIGYLKRVRHKIPRDSTEKGWREIIFVNWMTVILSGIILSTLNHYYWQKHEDVKRRGIYLQEKIKTYSSVSKELTNLIMHINLITDLKNKNPSDKKKINELQSEINNILSECGKYFSFIKIYFSQEANTKVEKFAEDLREYSQKKSKEIIDEKSSIYVKAKDLTNKLSTEIKKDFNIN